MGKCPRARALATIVLAGVAPAARSVATAGSCPRQAARPSALQPLASRASTAALYSTSRRSPSMEEDVAACRSGCRPIASFASTAAPCASKKCATRACPMRTAHMRGVSPVGAPLGVTRESAASMLALHLSSLCTSSCQRARRNESENTGDRRRRKGEAESMAPMQPRTTIPYHVAVFCRTHQCCTRVLAIPALRWVSWLGLGGGQGIASRWQGWPSCAHHALLRLILHSCPHFWRELG